MTAKEFLKDFNKLNNNSDKLYYDAYIHRLMDAYNSYKEKSKDLKN